MLQPLLLAQDLEGVLRIMQDPRRALNEAVSAVASAPASAAAEEQQAEQMSMPLPHGHLQLERRDSGTLGGFLLLRRPSAIAEGGKAVGAVARAYHLKREEEEEDKGVVVDG
jgi:hypothetical protein